MNACLCSFVYICVHEHCAHLCSSTYVFVCCPKQTQTNKNKFISLPNEHKILFGKCS
ncbi:hypothetical protein Hanom_Chr06g00573241 [Helianthus anomalus]